MQRRHSHPGTLREVSPLSYTSRIQTPRRDNASATRAKRLTKLLRSEHWAQIQAYLVKDETREANLEAKVQTLRSIIRAKEKEVQRLKNSDTTNSRLERELQDLKSENEARIRELEQFLKDSDVANSKLEVEVGKLKRERVTLHKRYQETLCQLTKAQEAEGYYYAKCEKVIGRYNNLHANHKDLDIKCQELATTNRNQSREISKISAQLGSRVAQLNKFTGDIARQTQRANTSAIRDDEYFVREFADLAKDIRNWSFAHFSPRKETSVPQAVPRDLRDDIREIAGGTSLPNIFANRPTSRRVVAGLIAHELKNELFNPLLLGFLPEPFLEFEEMVEKTGIQKSMWLSQTIGLYVKNEQFERGVGQKVDNLSKDLSEKLGGLVGQESGESEAPKRDQKLQTIVRRAANLAVEVSQQPFWFNFTAATPGHQFESCWMEDVGTRVSLEEDDPSTSEVDCEVSLSVFPCVRRQEHAESGSKREPIVINKAWVTVERGDGRAAVEREDGGTTSEESEPGVGVMGGCPSRPGEDGGEMGAQGKEGSEVSADLNVPATEKAVSLESISPELKEGANQEAGLAADIDLPREKGTAFL